MKEVEAIFVKKKKKKDNIGPGPTIPRIAATGKDLGWGLDGSGSGRCWSLRVTVDLEPCEPWVEEASINSSWQGLAGAQKSVQMIYGATENRKVYRVEVWAQLLGNSNQQQQLHFASFLSDLLDCDVVPMETETNQRECLLWIRECLIAVYRWDKRG